MPLDVGHGISGAAQGAATGAAAVAAVTAAAVAVGTALETGSITAAIEMGTIAAGAAAGSELGPIGAAAGAVIGALVALGGDATTGPMAFASSDPIVFMKELVGSGNPLLIEAMKDPKTAVALTVWTETGYPDTFLSWFADFGKDPNNAGHARVKAWLRAHPAECQAFANLPEELLTSDPIEQFAACIARIFYAAVEAPRTGEHQYAAFESGAWQTDEDWGGLILKEPDDAKTHLNATAYYQVIDVLKYAIAHPEGGLASVTGVILHPLPASLRPPHLTAVSLSGRPPLNLSGRRPSAIAQVAPYAAGGGLSLLLLRSLPDILPRGRL